MAIGTFDNFNPVVAGMKGNAASGLSLDLRQPAAGSSMRYQPPTASGRKLSALPDDFSSATYRLRPRRNGTTAGR